MKRAKYSEVPKDLRRNYKEEFIEFMGMVGICVAATAVFVLLTVLV